MKQHRRQPQKAYAIARTLNLRFALFLALSQLTFLTFLLLKH